MCKIKIIKFKEMSVLSENFERFKQLRRLCKYKEIGSYERTVCTHEVMKTKAAGTCFSNCYYIADKLKEELKENNTQLNINAEKSILEEAIEVRSGDRNADYGDAVENFNRIAEIYQAITGECLSPDKCCMVHIATKLSRERHNHKRDNLVDLCGYADILHRIREKKEITISIDGFKFESFSDADDN